VSRDQLPSLAVHVASSSGDLFLPPNVSPDSRGKQTFLAGLQLANVSVIELLAVALVAVEVLARFAVGWDFRALYQAGHEYLHLHSPYISGSLAQLTSRENFVYPLPIGAIFAPVSLIPYHVAAVVFAIASAASLALSLWILRVRDWRCYAAALIGIPAIEGAMLGTLSPMLALLLALLWRFRDRSRVAIPVVALLVLAKLFLWPLVVWLLITRRFRVAAASVAVCVAAVLVFSLPVGLGSLTHYPALLKSLSSFEAHESLSLLSLGQGLSGSYLVGLATAAAAGVALVCGMVNAARHGDEVRAFALSIVASLAMSPIVWNHYLVLLFVPLALIRPRFSVLWLASGWIMGDGAGLDRKALAILTVAAWLVIFAQANVFSGSWPMRARRGPHPLTDRGLSLGGALACLVALGWVLLTISGQVPAVAALTPPQRVASASGTALLRLSDRTNAICWDILTSGIPQRARAEIVQGKQVIAQKTIRSGRSEECLSYAWPRKNLAAAFLAGRVHLTLKIVAPDGTEALEGRVFLKPRVPAAWRGK
jgi:hypothetical protein